MVPNDRTRSPRDRIARCAPLAGDSAVLHQLVALVTLAAFAIAASACTAFKARDADPNAGGGSMYRAANPARTH